MAAKVAKTPHLAALDGLRGIAILLVMWYHIWEISWLSEVIDFGPIHVDFNMFAATGSAGVDLFFFISGFCLFYPYARTLFDGAPKQSLATFAYRRVLKIVPSYYLAIALMIALGFSHFDSQSDFVRQAVSHLTFTQNIWPETWSGIAGTMWSLATEVQFYIVFPLIAWCAMRRPLLTFATLIAFGNAYRFHIAGDFDALHEIDRLTGTIDLFAVGMLCAWAYRAIATRHPRIAAARRIWLGVALAGAIGGYTILSYQFDHRYDPLWNTTWKVTLRPMLDLALVPLTLGSLFTFVWWQRVLANPVLVFFSYISYNLYLWHQSIAQAIAAHHVIPFAGADPKADHMWEISYTASAFGVSIAVAWAITVLVEQPLLRRRPFSPAPRVNARLSEG